jgi:hypothetical protein
MVKRVATSIITAAVLMGCLVACGGSDTGRFEELVDVMGEVFIDPSAAESPFLLQEACLMEVLVNDGLTTWDWAINYYQSNYKTMVDWNDGGDFPPGNLLDANPDYDWDQFIDKALPCWEHEGLLKFSDSDS